MRSLSLVRFYPIVILLLLLLGESRCESQTPSSASASCGSETEGIIVETLTSAATKQSGLLPDDLLCHWQFRAKGGYFYSPLDLFYVEAEEGSRGDLLVEGFRKGRSRTWMLRQAPWGMVVHPVLSENTRALLSRIDAGMNKKSVEDVLEMVKANSDPQQQNDWLLPWILNRLAQIYTSSNRWEEAGAAYQAAIKSTDSVRPEIKAEVLLQWARALEAHDDLMGAEENYRRALAEFRRLNVESVAAAAALLNIGVVLLKQGRLSEAETAMSQGLVDAERLAPDSKATAAALVNLGVIAQNAGDLFLAEQYYRKALRIETANPNLISYYTLTLTNLGTLRFERGNARGAELYWRRASSVIGLRGESLELATILMDLSHAVLEQGRFRAAQKYGERALAIRERSSPGSLAVALSFLDLGKISKRRGDLKVAEQHYGEALRIIKGLPPPHPELATALRALSEILIARGDLAEAESYTREALSIIEEESAAGLDHAEAVGDLARILRLEHQNKKASDAFLQAISELESVIAKLGGSERDVMRYRATHQNVYKEYVQVLAELGRWQQAFEVSDASRARILADVLASGRVQLADNSDPVLWKTKQDLRDRIRAQSEARIRLLPGGDEQQIKRAETALRDLTIQYDDLEAQIRSRSRIPVLNQGLSLHEIQAQLDSDSVVLEYSLGKERSVVWIVTHDSFKFIALPRAAEIEAAAKALYRAISGRNRPSAPATKGGAQTIPFQQAANRLAAMILPPESFLTAKRLVIVADGVLHYIPFSMLPSSRSSGEPLMARHEIVNLPALSVLKELRESTARRSQTREWGSVAVLADPVFESDDLRVKRNHKMPTSNVVFQNRSVRQDMLRASASDRGFARTGRLSFPRLLYARREAESILAAAGGGRVLKAVDFQASRTTAMDPALGGYRIVHFATHGLVDSTRPEFSGLLLSMVDEHGVAQDGFLNLQDIYGLNLPVDLVVLSACQTALGKEVEGEGLVGLTRGFIYAGARRVVASLWSVDDRATSELMARFYGNMERARMTPAAALRKAQIEMWKQKTWRSPYYWAAFQIQGDWN